MSATDAAAPRNTEEQLVGDPIPPEVELGMLEVGLPASAATEGAARWALAEINKLRKALRPFAAFACDLKPGETCDCHNCKARDALANNTGERT